MHSPEVLAFRVPRPWPKINRKPTGVKTHPRFALPKHYGGLDFSPFAYAFGVELYFPSIIDVWHMEPGGADALTICVRRYKDKNGKWKYDKRWRWHFWHWRIKPSFVYAWRRSLLTRCAGCGGRSVKGNPVNVSAAWDHKKMPLWISEHGLYHSECFKRQERYHHAHNPEECYPCKQKRLPAIIPRMPYEQRELLDSLRVQVELGFMTYTEAVSCYNKKRNVAKWL